MKKIVRVLLVTTLAVMALCCAVMAADVFCAEKAEGVDAQVTFQTGGEKLSATLNDAAIQKGGEYMFFLVKQNAGGAYVPSETTIIYMNQVTATAAGTVSISDIFPMEMAECAVMVSGKGLAAPKIIAYVKTRPLGDINKDAYIDSSDAMLLKQHTASLVTLSVDDLLAGDVNGDTFTDSGDAMYILKYAASLITKFPAQA